MKNNQQVILVSIVIIIGLGLISNSFAEMELIPAWIKNTAGWWASNEISEDEFVNAVEFLINEGIILVSGTTTENNSSDSIPNWIKNTAGWWANDNTSDTEFVNALEFLVNNGIIQVHVNVDEKTKKELYDEIMADSTLSESQKLIKADKLFPFFSGYRGATFDGESVYFSPYYSNHGRHGWVIKFDTSKQFDDPNSWRTFNTASVVTSGSDAFLVTIGFQGALYNNGHVYLVPYFIEDADLGSRIVIYDTKLDFNDITAWKWRGLFDAYEDGVVEKNFVYFSPHLDKKNNMYAMPLRYDTTKSSNNTEAWEQFDTGIFGSYIGAASDGEKIYYGPFQQYTSYGTDMIIDKSTILIYDTNIPFTHNDSWEYHNVPYANYGGVGFNGTHIVFAPYCLEVAKLVSSEICGKIMFLEKDTRKISYSKLSYGAYNGVIETDDALYLAPRVIGGEIRSDFIQIKNSIEAYSPNIGLGGYWGGTYDGRYVYFSPYDAIPHTTVRNDEFLRYDTFQPFNNPDSWESISFSICDLDYGGGLQC